MKQQQKPGKRIVSKGAYMRVQGRRAGTGLLGASFYTIAVVFGASTVLLTIILILLVNQPCLVFPQFCEVEGAGFAIFPAMGFSGLGICLAPVGAYPFRRWGLHMIEAAAIADTGVPLTRANAAGLHALDSLVRASQEPAQAQEGVLLRAASQGLETPIEQLVRPAEAQE